MPRPSLALPLVLVALLAAACGGSKTPNGPDAQAAAVTTTGAGVYPGDGASKQALARWMGAAASAAGLPPELPVMAALVASNLTDMKGGDRNSVGFFQMRVGIWNQGKYPGYPDKPELQLEWFVDQALAAGKKRAAAGIDGEDSSEWGDWVADVERPPSQYRGRYQLRLDEARQLLGS